MCQQTITVIFFVLKIYGAGLKAIKSDIKEYSRCRIFQLDEIFIFYFFQSRLSNRMKFYLYGDGGAQLSLNF